MPPGDLFLEKHATRLALREKRETVFAGEARLAVQDSLTHALAAFLDVAPAFLPRAGQAPRIASYLPLGGEFDLNAHATADWLYPRMAPGRSLVWFRRGHDTSRLAANRFGILEAPLAECFSCDASVDAPWLVLVPALACDESQARIGYGGGYYDRFLEPLIANDLGIRNNNETRRVLCVCVVPEAMLVSSLPAEWHDVRMDIVLTEKCLRASL